MSRTPRRVWIESWQMQCCGESFAVGSAVAWNLEPSGDGQFLVDLIGRAEAGTLTDVYEHHAEDPEAGRWVRGIVRSIDSVFCAYSPVAEGSVAQSPVPGSGSTEARDSADGWEPEDGDRCFVGYVVRLDAQA